MLSEKYFGRRWLLAVLMGCAFSLMSGAVSADEIVVSPPVAHDFSAVFDADGVIVEGGAQWTWTLSLAAFGRASELAPVQPTEPTRSSRVGQQLGLAGQVRVYDVVEYERGGLIEWYAAAPEGVLQGFVVAARAPGAGPLIIDAMVGGDLEGHVQGRGTQIAFSQDGRERLVYQGLLVTDDTGRELPGHLEFGDGALRIVIDDAAAVYPVFIDPTISGVLPRHVLRWGGPGGLDDIGVAVARGEDGATTVAGAGEGGVVLLRYAPDGEALWTATYGDAGLVAAPVDLAVGDAGSAVVLTRVEDANGAFAVLVAYDGDGRVRWEKALPEMVEPRKLAWAGDRIYAAGEGSDGPVVIAVSVDDAIADVGWTATWTPSAAQVRDLALGDDGPIVVFGADEGAGQVVALRDKGEAVGVMWAALFGPDGQPAAVAVGDDGDVVVVGHTQAAGGKADYLVARYDALGWVVSKATYDGPAGGEDRATDVVLDDAGNALVTGRSQGLGGDFDFATLKVSAAGEVMWLARYDGVGRANDEPVAIALNAGGSLYVAGASEGSGTGLDYALVKYFDAGVSVAENWAARYNGQGGLSDAPAAMALGAGWLAVTGSTQSEAEDLDVTTVVYADCDGCLIMEICYEPGEMNPTNSCQYCDPAQAIEWWSMLPDGDACADNWFCNGADTCFDGACSEHAGDPCPDDGLYCNGGEVCNELDDECGHTPAPSCPDDGVYCNGLEFCDEEIDDCNHAGLTCVDDGVWCNGAEFCDAGTDQCEHEFPGPSNPRCPNDGLYCNGEEICDEDNEQCAIENVPECPDDGQWCNGTEFCNEQGDMCDSEYPPGAHRCGDDDLYCNGEEFCDEENDVCYSEFGPSNPRCTDDGAWCNGGEYCDEDWNLCAHEYEDAINPRCPVDDLWCNGDEFCDEGNDQCGQENVPDCPDDGAWCNGGELCLEQYNQCGHEYEEGSNPRCPDNPQYCDGDELCDEGLDQCAHENLPCGDDGFFCNGDEGCDETGDQCTHVGNPCFDNGIFCDGIESCEEWIPGCFSSGNPCDEWEVCNEHYDQCLLDCNGCLIDDVCYADGQLHPTNDCFVCNEDLDPEDWSFNDGYVCDDGDFCNGVDYCLEGACDEHAGNRCPDDLLWCNGAEYCVEEDEECRHTYDPEDPRCPDDSLWCTGLEYCDEDADACASQYDELTNPRCPDDTYYCNGSEFCDEGADVCGDTGNPCPPEQICDEGEDACLDECVGCYIQNVCYPDGHVNPANDCEKCAFAIDPNVWTPNDGAACNDGVFCNGVDQCAGNACTLHAGDPCPDDAQWCNGEEWCDEGLDQCAADNVPECLDDGQWCNGAEFCNEDLDACDAAEVPDCGDDGQWCNGDEFCDEIDNQCTTTGDRCFDDGSYCTGVESCDEAADECVTTGDPCLDDGLFCNGEESCNDAAMSCVSSGDPCEAGTICNETSGTCDPLGDDDDDDDNDNDDDDDNDDAADDDTGPDPGDQDQTGDDDGEGGCGC